MGLRTETPHDPCDLRKRRSHRYGRKASTDKNRTMPNQADGPVLLEQANFAHSLLLTRENMAP